MRLFSFIGSAVTHLALEAGLLLLIATAYLGSQRLGSSGDISARVDKSAAAIAAIERISLLSERAENRWRNFWDTGNQDSAVDYNKTVNELNSALPNFQAQFTDSGQQARTARVRALLHSRIESANAGILHKQRQLRGDAPVPIRWDDGSQTARQLRDTLFEMTSFERQELIRETQGHSRAGLDLLGWMALGVAAAAGLIFAGSVGRRIAFARERRRNRDLQQRSILLDTILNSMSEALIVVDEEGRFTHYNAAAQRIVGTKLRAVGSESEADAIGFHNPENGETLSLRDLPFNRALRGHQEDDIEIYVKNGAQPEGLYISASSRPLQSIDGRIGGALVVFKDVSKRKELEQEWIKAREAAIEASKMKSDFLAAMSHEIRTPMNGVIGMTTLLGDTPLSEEQSDYVGTIQRSAQSLLRLINDILDHSKIEAGKITLEQKPFDLEFLGHDIIETFRALTREKNIGLEMRLEGQAPWTFTGDQGRLRQILVNLVGNAVKFTEKGMVQLQITSTPAGDRRRRLLFEVKDTGPGMTDADRKSLFQKYFQTGTGKRAGGTGLGLSICKQLVGLMDGDIGVESVPGVGTNFWFTVHLETCAMEKAAGGTVAHFDAIFSGRVLIAEDQPVNQRVASRYLEKLGLQADLAPNGQIAADMALSRDYDLIFMDCQMPVMTGYEATRKIRQRETSEGGHRTIIALTAEGTSGERDLCYAAGMDDFLTKPLDLDALVSVLQRRLPPLESRIDAEALEKLKNYVVNDQSLASALITEYESSTPTLLESMRKAAMADDLRSLSEAAHALKSNSAALGAKRLASMCQAIEDLDDSSNAFDRLKDLEKEYHKTLAELRPHSASSAKAA